MNDEDRLPSAPSTVRHGLVGPANLWEMKRRFQIAFLRQVGLTPRHTLLDLGCGTLRGGIPLIDYLESGHYAGVEVRRAVLDEGRRELVECRLTDKHPQLVHCERLGNLDLGRTFDVAWAFQVLIHMHDDALVEAIAAVARHLHEHGVLYATVNVGSEPPGTWQGFPVIHRERAFYEDVFRRQGFVASDLGALTAFGHVVPGVSFERQSAQRMLKATRL